MSSASRTGAWRCLDARRASGRMALGAWFPPDHPLRRAALKVVAAIVAGAAIVDGATASGLHFAAARGDVGAIEVLLDAGMDPNDEGSYSEEPLHDAAEGGHVKAIKVLLAAGAEPNVRDHGLTTPLHFAAGCGRVEAVEVLLKAGADPNIMGSVFKPNNHGGEKTPLHVAVGEGYICLGLRDTSRRRLRVAKVLLAGGADPNAVTEYGSMPLHTAVRHGNLPAVEVLLENGADPNAKTGGGVTPLHVAVKTEVVKVLLAAGADPNAQDSDGDTPLRYAADRGTIEIIKLLLAAGAQRLSSR